MTREIGATKLSIGLIAAMRGNGIDRFILSDYGIERGAEAVLKKLEKNDITIDDKFKFRDGFCSIGFEYVILDYAMSGTCYIKLSEVGAKSYFNRRMKGKEDFEFFKSLAKRFYSRARRVDKCARERSERNHEVYAQLKKERREAYFGKK